MKICVITDNVYMYKEFIKIISSDTYMQYQFDFYSSTIMKIDYEYRKPEIINLKEKDEKFFSNYDLFISLHSKQVFPKELVDNHICINVHPGYNPYNRGWYPHVFSIINKMPAGITIHRMDSELDHGAILFQREIEINEYDTSREVYKKIQELEILMLKEYLPVILNGEYKEVKIYNEGNINYKNDFYNLCQIDLNKKASYGEVIDYLRAMTFEGFNNAYFIDSHGHKVYVSIKLDVSKV